MPYELLEEEDPSEESFLKGVARQPARTASNLATRAIGLPGDVLSLVNEFIARPTQKLFTGQKGVPYEETLLGKAIPTTETHRKGLEEHTGEFLKPQNKVEQFADDLIEDTALMLNPFAKGAQIAKAIPKKFAIAVGGNVAKDALKDMGAPESASNWAKMGTLFFLSFFDKPGAAKELSKLYKQAETSLPEGASVNAERLMGNLDNLEKTITKGRPRSNVAPSEKFVLDEIDKITDVVDKGKASVDKLWAQKRSLNEALEKQLFETPTKQAQGRARKLAKQLTGWMNQELSEYGNKNPAFGKPFKAAEEGFGVMAKSNAFSNFIEKNLKYTPATSGLLHMFGGQIGGALSKVVIPYHLGKLGYRVANSKTLRDHYLRTLKAVSSENAAVFNKELQSFDEAIQEEESKDRYEFVD